MRRICGEKLILTNLENTYEPITKCRVGDWLELWAGWVSKSYQSFVRQDRLEQWGSGWKVSISKAYALNPFYFQFYDSYSTPVLGGSAGMGQVPAWKRLTLISEADRQRKGKRLWKEVTGRLRLLWWFYRRNMFSLSWRLAVVVLFIWLSFFGGHVIASKKMAGVDANGDESGNGVARVNCAKVAGTGTGSGSVAKKAGGKQVRKGDGFQGADVVDGKIVETELTGTAEERLKTLEGSLQRVVVEAARLATEAASKGKKVKELEDHLGELGGAVLISGNSVRFESGDTIKVGEKIDYGPFAGLSIAGIDPARRAVRLSDGRLLRLGVNFRRVPGDGKAGGKQARVQTDLRGAKAGGDDAEEGSGGSGVGVRAGIFGWGT